MDEANKGLSRDSGKTDKSVWALWQLWALSRMRYLDPSQTTYDNDQIKHHQELLLKRTNENVQKLFTNPKNLNRQGKFCFDQAKDSMLETLNEKELDAMIGFCDSFLSDIQTQQKYLRVARAKNVDKGERFQNSDTTVRPSRKTENSVWALWKMWALNRMIYVDKGKTAYDKEEMKRQERHLLTRSEENVKDLFQNSQNRNREGKFDFAAAKQNLMDSLTEQELDAMLRYSLGFSNEIRRQQKYLQTAKSQIKTAK